MLSESDIALYAFQKYGDTALQAAFCCLGSRADAEDVTQEVFFALHKAPRAFNDDEHLKAYILRAVINRCRNLRKSLRRRIRISLEDANEAELAEQPDSIREIIAMIRALPPPYNAVVYLHDCEGYTLREIADMLGKKENTIGAQLRRGREKLRMEIRDSGVLE
jgi:RNA polymerase sigma-70 factor (ECF subfamily)